MSWRNRFREDNELLMVLVRGWPGKLYLAVALLTFGYSWRTRWPICAEQECTIGFVKSLVWGMLWPLYWINQVTDSVLFRPWV